MPPTKETLFWFLVGWQWARLTAHENEWINDGESSALEAHGQRLAAEAQRAIEEVFGG